MPTTVIIRKFMAGRGLIQRGIAMLGQQRIRTAEVTRTFTDLQGQVCTVRMHGYQEALLLRQIPVLVDTAALMRAWAFLNWQVTPPNEYDIHIFQRFNKTVGVVPEHHITSYQRMFLNYAMGQSIDRKTIAMAARPIARLGNNGIENLDETGGYVWVSGHEWTHSVHQCVVDDYEQVYKENYVPLETQCEQISAAAVGILTGRTEPIRTNNPYISTSELVYPTYGRTIENPLYTCAVAAGLVKYEL
jgi:hypothetical protein